MVGELEHQAFHDGLTNLPNRALFRERVGHALRRRLEQAPSHEVAVRVAGRILEAMRPPVPPSRAATPRSGPASVSP
jgi:hypothetical protein